MLDIELGVRADAVTAAGDNILHIAPMHADPERIESFRRAKISWISPAALNSNLPLSLISS